MTASPAPHLGSTVQLAQNMKGVGMNVEELALRLVCWGVVVQMRERHFPPLPLSCHLWQERVLALGS